LSERTYLMRLIRRPTSGNLGYGIIIQVDDGGDEKKSVAVTNAKNMQLLIIDIGNF
jgi:hypothetical protein